jgi:hypothetical protein
MFIMRMVVVCQRLDGISRRRIGGRLNESSVVGLRRGLFGYSSCRFVLRVNVFSMTMVMSVLFMAFLAMVMPAMAMLVMMMIVVMKRFVRLMIVPVIVMVIRISIMEVLRRMIADLRYIRGLLPVDERGRVFNDVTLYTLAVTASP